MSSSIKVNLGDVISYRKGYAFKSSNFISAGIPVIRISDTTRTSIKENLVAYVDPEYGKGLKDFELKEKDVVLTTVGSRPPMYDSMVGKAILVPRKNAGALLNQNMVILRGAPGFLEQDFLAITLRTKRFVSFIESLIRGNANQVSIALKDLFKYKFVLPSIAEQKAIARILSTWDEAIEKTERLVGTKEKQFDWLKSMLLLNNPNAKHWTTNILGQFIEEKNEKSEVHDLYPCLTSSRRGMFLQDEYFSKQVASKDNTGYKIMDRGDFTFRSMSDDGIFVFNQQNIVDKGLISPAYAVFASKKNMDADYLYYFLNSSAFRRILSREVQGGTRTALKLNALKKLDIEIPELEEQKAISSKLNIAQREINMLLELAEHYRKQKRGLMQKLLTGKWRVNTDKEVA